jgi:hypothetical protein
MLGAAPAPVPRPAPIPAPPVVERLPEPGPSRPRGGFQPTSGAYLGGAGGHRVSFTVLDGRVRNLRVDRLLMAEMVEIEDREMSARHLGFSFAAEWVDQSHVRGHVKMRNRWGLGAQFDFQARHRLRDVLSG